MKETILKIPARALPKGSTHSFAHRKSGKIITKQVGAKKLYAYQSLIAYHAAKSGMIISDGPIIIESFFYFKRPKSHFVNGKRGNRLKMSAPTYHMQTPDVDKLVRAVLDALTDRAYKDDKQVINIVGDKFWSDGLDRVEIKIIQFPT